MKLILSMVSITCLLLSMQTFAASRACGIGYRYNPATHICDLEQQTGGSAPIFKSPGSKSQAPAPHVLPYSQQESPGSPK